MNDIFLVGDEVEINHPGSWCHGRCGIILRLWVEAPDEVFGHLIQIAGFGTTIVPPEYLL